MCLHRMRLYNQKQKKIFFFIIFHQMRVTFSFILLLFFFSIKISKSNKTELPLLFYPISAHHSSRSQLFPQSKAFQLFSSFVSNFISFVKSRKIYITKSASIKVFEASLVANIIHFSNRRKIISFHLPFTLFQQFKLKVYLRTKTQNIIFRTEPCKITFSFIQKMTTSTGWTANGCCCYSRHGKIQL